MTETPSPEDTAVESPLEAVGIDLPDQPDEAIELLAARLLEAKREAESHLDDLKRVAADFENFRKRTGRDRDDLVASASRRIAAALLPVLDSLDAAAGVAVETATEERLRDGLASTRDQILDALATEGVRPIEITEGDPFDPTLHEAVSGGGDGHLVVTGVLRRGYTLGDRLLRAAMVSVAAEDVSEEPTDDREE